MSVKFPVRWPAGIDVMLIFDVSLVCLWYLAGPRCFGQVVPTETLARCGSKDDTAQIKRNKHKWEYFIPRLTEQVSEDSRHYMADQ